MMISGAWIIQDQMLGCLTNDKFDMIWKEAVVTYFKVLSRKSIWEEWANPR
jgi:hypothetical protein